MLLKWTTIIQSSIAKKNLKSTTTPQNPFVNCQSKIYKLALICEVWGTA